MLKRRPFYSISVALIAGVLAAGCTSTRQSPISSDTGRAKGIYKVGNPYQIDGVWYYPAEDWSYDETGIASWYGPGFHAKDTANGESFDQNAITAAHRTLPMPSIVEVTNLDNGRVLRVRVNDRGPYARGRIIDMSRKSAQLLGFEGQGTAKVRVRILVPESMQVASLARLNGSDDQKLAQAAAPAAAPRAAVAAQPLGAPSGAKAAPPPPAVATPVPKPAEPVQVASTAPPPLPETVAQIPVKPTGIYVQAGAFSKPDNAQRLKSKLDGVGAVKVVPVSSNGVSVWRVRLGPLASVEEADKLLARVVDSGVAEARIVVD